MAVTMDYMAQALSMAGLALGKVSPNPAVGAVIVRDGRVVAQGCTQPPGSDHAEIVALKQAGEAARGGVMYVTLEPCCHYGRTPPCTQSIIAAGITEIHIATLDVSPKVSGCGRDELEKASIKIVLGEHEAEAKQVIEAYAKHITEGLPFVTVKFAMSLDGKIATRSGDSHWISGEQSRQLVHRLRFTSDAIMVGAGTVLADDPLLTVRDLGGDLLKTPLRVIVDGSGRTSPEARVYTEPGSAVVALAKTLSAAERAAFRRVGVEVLELPLAGTQVDLKELFRLLGERGVTSVMVEGGGGLLGALFDAGLVDKVIVFIAPVIIGGHDAVTPVGGSGVERVKEALRLDRLSVERIGDDIMVTGYIGG